MTAAATSAGRVWFVTGASRGLGRAFTEAALAAGDRVVAVARSVERLEPLVAEYGGRLHVLPLDVTDRAAVHATVDEAVRHFGRLDVVVNNAGFLAVGAVEEMTEELARAQMETNFFGALWVNQAVAPHLRAQRGGRVLQISSIGALGGFPFTGLYSASKFALEGMSEALAAELAPFGVHVTIVEPGGYWTDLYTTGTVAAPFKDAYASLRAEMNEVVADNSVDSLPEVAAEAVMKLVSGDDPPLRLLLGSMVYDLAFEQTRKRMATWAEWEETSRAAERPVPAPEGYGT
ncbi:SDR family NAD(P)-dependent oxidoreductase [Marinitenerispora sediminis]|uniref:Short-chain dehydrogenase n=1 Tax=Marinitenerispora sediminis TaxID=1931232 RepID=A0A368T4J8_9ACTN|nr:SDR family NAD(P)-dependent oxidoreductase [Marinitenerispora sediminis]RCV57804.1 short-chain dehydrogenase [Marinitenerispora sediminis]RCV58373.1 short-chain dehydrogenase [Marinitenerispora sediminis]RCV59550.1 short-chain dehydrogenase [Marinitenerispora sediminis]